MIVVQKVQTAYIMAAKDYEICPALFNAFIAKVSKRDPNLMTDDRRIITDREIIGLIRWYLKRFCVKNNTDRVFINENDKTTIEIVAHGKLLEEIKENSK